MGAVGIWMFGVAQSLPKIASAAHKPTVTNGKTYQKPV
jgi:hypothetical protein